MSCVTAREFSGGDICGEWIYVGDTQQSISQSGIGWFTNQSFGEGMKTYDELVTAVHESYEQTQDVSETAIALRVSRSEVLEALGFSDEWSMIFDDE